MAVTGCTDGIGKDLALEFSKRGFKLLLFGRNPSKLNEVQSQTTQAVTH
jgi:short-subunit dehydrogenase